LSVRQQAVVGGQDRHGALRVDPAERLAELLAAAQVDLHRLVAMPFSASRMRARARARRGGAVVER
jgi:hypothetical protein